MDIPNVSRLRIAIALAILKHKPPSESCYAYVLDLRTIFSFASRGNVANVGDLWRNHALNLEKNYTALKTHFECKGIRSFISLNSTPESDQGPKLPQRLKDGTDGIKKKGKKKVITDDPDEHFNSHHANDPVPFSLKDLCNDLYHGAYHQKSNRDSSWTVLLP
ncbi:hypothetical protein BJ912DRAFT_950438 [Pholiota molesta]|nr:hypothetical protein BJ912DRAFT_950438 [Pholiota molesta]